MPISDRIGRAFEYCVTKAILSRLEALYPGKVKVTPRARNAQSLGRKQFESLGAELKKQFESSGRKIAEWLANNKLRNVGALEFEKPKEALEGFLDNRSKMGIKGVELDRIPDVAGVRGDVTDIRIKFFSKQGVATVNISLKRRHAALKHPRLTRVPEWIGLGGTKEARQYINAYESVWNSFFKKCKKVSPTAKKFRELKVVDPSFIEKNLYEPIYALVASFLKQNIKSPLQVQQMFSFMVGKFNYIKFIERNGKVEVRDFSNIPRPNSVKIEHKRGGYLYMHFDNGWRISGRLHTATQWLRKSIKFDIQPVNLDDVVPVFYI